MPVGSVLSVLYKQDTNKTLYTELSSSKAGARPFWDRLSATKAHGTRTRSLIYTRFASTHCTCSNMSCCCKSGNPLSQQQWKPGQSSGLLCREWQTPGQDGETGGKDEYSAPTDQSIQHCRAEAGLWVEPQVLCPGALIGLNGPNQLHLGPGAPFNKLSRVGGFLLSPVFWGAAGSCCTLTAGLKNSFNAIFEVLPKSKLPRDEEEWIVQERGLRMLKAQMNKREGFLPSSCRGRAAMEVAQLPRALPAGELSVDMSLQHHVSGCCFVSWCYGEAVVS